MPGTAYTIEIKISAKPQYEPVRKWLMFRLYDVLRRVLSDLGAELAGKGVGCDGAWRQRNGVLPWFLDLQAARTDSGRARLRILLRTVTAIRVSTFWAGLVCERKVSLMIRSSPPLRPYGSFATFIGISRGGSPSYAFRLNTSCILAVKS